jgi:hypothetical protein
VFSPGPTKTMNKLTRDVHITIQACIQRDLAYVQALWNEVVQLILQGEPQTAKIILRDLLDFGAPNE